MGLSFDLSRIEGSPGFLLNRAYSSIRLGLFNTFKKNGFNITHEHWAILRLLWNEEQLTQTQLAQKAQKDRPNITRIVDVLERNGYVQRAVAANDRRTQNITLTDKGKSIQNHVTSLTLSFLEEAFADVTQEEYDDFAAVLEKITQNLNKSQVS